MLPVLASVAPQCVSAGGTYAAEVDGEGKNVGAQYIGGSIRLSGIALNGATLWMTGTAGPSIPLSPGALASPNLTPKSPQGAYLGAVNFAALQPPPGTPQIDCVVDAADFALTGPIVPFQILTIFGNGLGPATPVNATDNSTTTLGGVRVGFGSLQAPLLYVSSNQINVAVPMVHEEPATTVMQVNVNGVPSAQVQYAVTPANPALFVVPGTFQSNLELSNAVATNADGSMNSSSNPAQLGSVVTVFVNGLTPDPQNLVGPAQLATGGGWSIVNVSQASPFVTQLELRVPAANMNFECGFQTTTACIASFGLQDSTPYFLPGSIPSTAPGPAFYGTVWAVGK
jgi:uncharacterized protein (TIGR03437 family)